MNVKLNGVKTLKKHGSLNFYSCEIKMSGNCVGVNRVQSLAWSMMATRQSLLKPASVCNESYALTIYIGRISVATTVH